MRISMYSSTLLAVVRSPVGVTSRERRRLTSYGVVSRDIERRRIGVTSRDLDIDLRRDPS